MVITYQGDGYFKVQSGDTVILVDPTNARSFKGASLVLSTEKPASVGVSDADEGAFFVDYQGEYEINGIRFQGWSAGNDEEKEKTVYRVELDETVLVFLGRLKKEPSPEIQEFLKDADIIFIPAGGKPYLAADKAAKLVRQLEPGIIVPSLFKDLKPFLKELNQPDCETEEKLVIKKKEINPKAMVIKCLKF